MRRFAPALSAASLLTFIALSAAAPVPAAELTLERVYGSPSLSGPRPRQLKLAPDGSLATLLRNRADDKDRFDLWAVDTRTGESRMLVDSLKLAGGPLSEAERMNRERQRIADIKGITDYGWSPDSRALLVPVDGDLWLATRDGAVRQLTKSAATETDARLSPGGRFASFVRDRALYSLDLATGAERRVAGEDKAEVSWGVAEFIAQEELGCYDGHWWAPDDSRLAVARVDESPVGIVTRAAIGADGTRLFSQRYPAAGTPNAIVELWIVAPDGSGRVKVDLGPDPDIYLARVAWAPDAKSLYVQRLSRDQMRLDLLRVDAATGTATVVLTETSPVWINLTGGFRALTDGSLIWTSERSGFRHLYRWHDGRLDAITQGNWPVGDLVGVDEKAGLAFFEGFADGSLEQHVYAVDYRRPGPPRRLTERGGWADAVMDEAGRRLIVTRSTPDQPPQVWLADQQGRRLAWIEENRLDAAHPYAPFVAGHAKTEFGTIPAEDGTPLDWRVLKPAGKGPFPVLFQVYGGPHAHNVKRAWGGPLEQYLVRQGWAVFQLDNRGSANRGLAFEAPIRRAMGGVEVRDQLAGLAWLKAQPWAAADRIAVNGWSYGGYMVLKLLEAAPGAFAAGIAGAPVTDWRLYDTAYTERYMGTPQRDAAAYEKSGALGDAAKLTTPLLLIHGLADDNVVFQHSTALMARLQKAGQTFDVMVYPGATHATPGLEVHGWKTRLRFLERVMGQAGR